MESNEVVKSSDITLRVGLNAEQVPIKIEWGSSDRNNGELEECKAMAIALFDKAHRDTLRIDLWTKDMMVDDMQIFFHQMMLSMSDTYARATGDSKISNDMKEFALEMGHKMGIIKPNE